MNIALIKRMMDACYQAKRVRDLLPALPDGVLPSFIQYLDAIQTLEQQGVRYGLLLGQQSIPPGEGSMHQTACLTALALYENN